MWCKHREKHPSHVGIGLEEFIAIVAGATDGWTAMTPNLALNADAHRRAFSPPVGAG